MTVHLVGAGPGSADLLTLRAAKLLASAEVVVHDRLVSDDVLALCNPTAERVDVGKVPGASSHQDLINDLLVSLGSRFQCVVRLKGGDPFVFGRGGEEAHALVRAGIDVDVVPGVTSAFSAPLAAGIPVTHRGVSTGVLVITGHLRDDAEWDLSSAARGDLTLVVLMGVAQRGRLQRHLLERGFASSTPVAVIERAWSPSQRVTRARLDELHQLDVRNPAVIVVGAVAALDVRSVNEVLSSVGVA